MSCSYKENRFEREADDPWVKRPLLSNPLFTSQIHNRLHVFARVQRSLYDILFHRNWGDDCRCHLSVRDASDGIILQEQHPSPAWAPRPMVLAKRATHRKVREIIYPYIPIHFTYFFPSIARTLADWVAEYGPVITLRQGNRIIVVIGRVDVRFLICLIYRVC